MPDRNRGASLEDAAHSACGASRGKPRRFGAWPGTVEVMVEIGAIGCPLYAGSRVIRLAFLRQMA